VRLGRLPANTDEDLRFVQDRVALFAKTTFLISSMFLVVTSTADLLSVTHRYAIVARLSHVAGTLIALSCWRLAGGRRAISPASLQTLDLLGTLGICWSFVGMGHYGQQPYGFYTAMLAVTHVSMSRAMIVPSVPSRTLFLSVASVVGLVVSSLVLPIAPELAAAGATRERGLLAAVLWSTAACAIATVASKVIYGLQERAREARQLGQYALEEKIGEGGMGEVYRAHHAMLRRPTAVKLLAGDGSEGQLRRFEKEVQLTARLTHPNTISIYDYGRTPDGVFYYAMELLDGLTLEDLVDKHGPQPAGRVIHLIKQVCGALKEAHGVGLIHRDIKPANIYVCRRGDMPDFIKVLDFGLVRELKSDGAGITRSNLHAVVGTPMYMSPEAILTPDHIDARADIYGLGCVAYGLLTGVTPFTGHTVVELCAHHLHSVPPPPSERRAVREDLEQVILGCLAKDPASRPQSAAALLQALDQCCDAKSWTEADAEVWWAAEARSMQLPAEAPAAERPPRPRTIMCDLHARFAKGEPRA